MKENTSKTRQKTSKIRQFIFEDYVIKNASQIKNP